MARVKNMPSGKWLGWREIYESFNDAAWGLLLIVIIMIGIYGIPGVTGAIFTPTEAAAVASIYAFIVSSFIYRDMGPLATEEGETRKSLFRNPQALITAFWHEDTRNTLFNAGKLIVTLMFVIANALLLKHVITDEQLPQKITSVVIVAPLVFPIAMELGIDPIHLGIIMVVNMEIGMITPPVGLNLFVTAGVANMSMMGVVRAALPFLAIMFVFLILITYVPWISTVLPNSVMGPEIIMK